MTLSNGTPVANHNRECIQVAVIGGGIGGLCLALGLQKYSHLDVHIYEAAPAIHEIGAGVTLAPNATNALELISPQVKARLKGHATTNMWPKYQNTWADYKMVCLKRLVRSSFAHRALCRALVQTKANYSIC